MNGEDIFARVGQIINQLESQERDINQGQSKIGDLEREMDEKYTELAKIYLSGMESQTVSTALFTGQNINEIVAERIRKGKTLETTITSLSKQKLEREKEIESISQNLVKTSKELEDSRAKYDLELKESEIYPSLKEAAEKAQQAIDAEIGKAQERRAAIAKATRTFAENEIFQYLLNKPDWNKNDSERAKATNFEQARAKYLELQSLPERIEQELSDARKPLEETIRKKTEKEEEFRNLYDIPKLEGKHQELSDTQKAKTEDLQKINEDLLKQRAEAESMESFRDSYSQDALYRTKEKIKKMDLDDMDSMGEVMKEPRATSLIGRLVEIQKEKSSMKLPRNQSMDVIMGAEISTRLGRMKELGTYLSAGGDEFSETEFNDGTLDFDNLIKEYQSRKYGLEDVKQKLEESEE